MACRNRFKLNYLKMKRMFYVLMMIFVVSLPAFAAETATTTDFGSIFGSLSALVAAIPIVVELVKKLLPKLPSWVTQLLSWLIGIAITIFGWWMHLGFLNGLPWYLALAYGFGASLAANGIADTGLVQWIIGLFGKKVK